MEFSDENLQNQEERVVENQQQPSITNEVEQQSVVQEPQTEVLSEEDEEDSTLAFPTARVVRILREEIRSGKQIRGEVKGAVNEWLGSTLRKVAKEMDKSPYGSIGMADFNRASRPFDMIEHIVKDKERIMLAIEKLKVDADQIKRDLQRFYTNLTGEEQVEG